jgi:tRNA pseudouridine38-40 synthase
VLERIHSGEDLSAPDNEATSAKAAAEETENGETKEAAQSQDGADVSDQQAEAPKANSTVESVQPKKRELGPLDFALRDVKQVYVNAKRRYRVTPERLERLQAALDMYKGTRNFHNYTVQKAFKDPSAKRHIKSFEVNKTPIIINDTEWLSLKVHGQSFMMHQIRKMVGLASLVVRCGTPLDRISQSYQAQKMAIPKAPGLGLLLERPVFDNYNERATSSLGKETIDFSKYEEKLEAFKNEHIYQRIFDVEEKESA